MKPIRMRLAAVIAAGAAIAIAAPVSTAAADTPAPAVVPVGAVIGPTFVTTAPATFVNTNTQVAGGPTMAGDQVSP